MAARPWSPWYTEISEELGRKTDSLRCNLCHSITSKKRERQLSHLGYEQVPGKRNTGVALCPKLTPYIHSLFKNCGGHYPRHNGELFLEPCTTSTMKTASSTEYSTPGSTGGDSCVGSTQVPIAVSQTENVAPPPNFPTATEPRRLGDAVPRAMRQSVISEGFQEVERRELDKAWARFFYEANVPFAVARSAAFKDAVMRTATFKKPYVPPSYHDIRTRLLVQAKADLQAQLNNRMAESVRKFGGTLALDGWTSVTSRPLCNAMLVSPAGELFLGAVDTTGNEKNAEYMASIMEKFLVEVGPQNIVQVCTDNASSMLKAAQLITDKFPHIYIQGCAAHAMDLLLEDWGKIPWIKRVVEKAKYLVRFVKNRQMPLAVFREHEAHFSLLLPGQTRFASNFIMIDRLLKVKNALEFTVVDPRWDEYVKKLRDSRQDKARTLSRNVRKIALDQFFWKRCTNFREMVAPVVYALREFDAKEPCMGKVLHILRNLENHVLALRNEPFNMETEVADIVERDFYVRKRMITTDLHSAAALLNPYLLHDQDFADDADAITACKRVLRKLCTPETYPDAVAEFIAFRNRTPPFHDMLDPKHQKCSPYAWWDFEGACGKVLAPIAKRILAQTVSSSSCERNWSSYSFVHNKRRNRLLPQRANDLVYVYTNSRLLADGKLTDEKRWYAENLEVEDPQARESENSGDSIASSTGHGANYAMEHIGEDVDSGPPLGTTDFHRDFSNEYDFTDDDIAGENDDDLLPIARYLNGDGMVSSKNILLGGPSTAFEPTAAIQTEHDAEVDLHKPGGSITPKENNSVRREEDIMVLKGKGAEDVAPLHPTSPLHLTEKNTHSRTEQTSLLGGASRSLFGSSCAKETRTALKSSHGLVSLSKHIRPRLPQGQSDDASSDGNLPLSTVFRNHSGIPPRHAKTFHKAKVAPTIKLERAEVNIPTALGPIHPPKEIRKRKAPMQPFSLSPPEKGMPTKTPLDDIDNSKRFKTISSMSTRARFKDKDASISEDEPSATSGAEVKGDSDYKLPTGISD